MGLGTQKMKADTNVRSVDAVRRTARRRRRRQAGRHAVRAAVRPPVAPLPSSPATQPVHMPSLLKQNEPVNVTANRLDYDGTSSLATYKGNARLWQTETDVKADKIVVDDKTGNLHAIDQRADHHDADPGERPEGSVREAPAAKEKAAGSGLHGSDKNLRPSRRPPSPTSCSTRTRSTAPPTPATRT